MANYDIRWIFNAGYTNPSNITVDPGDTVTVEFENDWSFPLPDPEIRNIDTSPGIFTYNSATYTGWADIPSDNPNVVRSYVLTVDVGDGSADSIIVGYNGANPSGACTITTRDYYPNSFTWTDLTSQARSTQITSNTITVTGIDTTVDVTFGTTTNFTGVQYKKNSGSWTNIATFTVVNNDTIQLRGTTSNQYSTAHTVPVTVGGSGAQAGRSDTWSVTTLANRATLDVDSNFTLTIEIDTPNLYYFEHAFGTNAAYFDELIEGDTVTFAVLEAQSGETESTDVLFSGFDSNFWTVSSNFTIDHNDTPITRTVKSTAEGSSDTINMDPVNSNYLGSADVTFTALSLDDPEPNAFSFVDKTGQELSTNIDSATVTINGIDTAVDVEITGGTGAFRVNGTGTWYTTNQTDIITNGQTLEARVLSSGTSNTATNITLKVGKGTQSQSDTFTATTADFSPASFDLGSGPLNIGTSQYSYGEAFDITGVTSGKNIAMSVTNGGEYSIDSGQNWQSSGNASLNDTVLTRVQSSASYNTNTTITVNVGGGPVVSDTYSVTTMADPGDGLFIANPDFTILPINLREMRDFYGGPAPFGGDATLTDYYKGGLYVPNLTPQHDDINTSGTIALSDFVGAGTGMFFSIVPSTESDSKDTTSGEQTATVSWFRTSGDFDIGWGELGDFCDYRYVITYTGVAPTTITPAGYATYSSSNDSLILTLTGNNVEQECIGTIEIFARSQEDNTKIVSAEASFSLLLYGP